jgi:hypothetical protein
MENRMEAKTLFTIGIARIVKMSFLCPIVYILSHVIDI